MHVTHSAMKANTVKAGTTMAKIVKSPVYQSVKVSLRTVHAKAVKLTIEIWEEYAPQVCCYSEHRRGQHQHKTYMYL